MMKDDVRECTTLTHQELAALIVKEKGIHDGFWSIYVEFKIYGVNFEIPKGALSPAAVVPVPRIGIQRWERPNGLTVDAAKVNPAKRKRQ